MSAEDTTLKSLEKVLDLIKSSGWQTAAAAVALGALLWFVQAKVLPPFEQSWIIHVVAFGFLLCVALTIAAICSTLAKPVRGWIGRFLAHRSLSTKAEKAVHFMTEKERTIIGYLLHHKMKVFDADQDGGYAASLLGRGFITILARYGQMLDPTRVPMTVPEPVWEVWGRHRNIFPYKPVLKDGHEIHPWRIHWMER